MEENTSRGLEPLNLKEIFSEKNPALAKMIPGFIYRFINRRLHIDFFNDFIRRNGHLKGIEFIGCAVEEFHVREHIHGFENIPDEGRFIFSSNHPLGGFDALLLMKNVQKKLGKLKFLANDILMKIPNLSPVFIPVNKHGTNSREAAKLLDEAYNSDIQILIFPAGLASRKIKGEIVDLEWKKHFISKAIKHKRDIIPVFVDGRNSNRFYRWANTRKLLKIKWNLEMFWLPDETIKHRDTDIHIYFGKPIPYATFDRSRTHSEWARWVKDIVYKLPKNAEPTN